MLSPIFLIIGLPYFALSIAAEIYLVNKMRRRQRKEGSRNSLQGYENRDTFASLSMGVISLIVGIFLGYGTLKLSLFSYGYKFISIPNKIVAWSLAMVGWDLVYYFYHRASHRINILWANHVQHHSSQKYNLSTALRQPVTSFGEWLFFPFLCLLGLSPFQVATAGAINLLYQFWIHTEIFKRLPGWFEAVFNTPSHHRVHHGSNGIYLDKNFGGILIVWDKLFSTFEKETETVRYGLVHNIDSYNPITITFHQYADIIGNIAKSKPKNLLGFLFMPPGWRPAYAAS